MTSATTTEFSAPQAGPRFLIGGVMLAVMAAWVYANHDPAPAGIVAVLGATAALAMVVGVAGLRHQAHNANANTTGLIALVIGVVTAACGGWLAMKFKLEALGEILGLGLFSALAVAAGVQERSAGLTTEEAWKKVHSLRALLGIGMAALGTAGIGSFFYAAFVQKIGADFAPELVGLMLGGFILFFAGFYLLASKDPPPEIGTLRLFVIIVGTLLGSILTLVSIARAVLWNNEIFRSGVAAWSGSEAWRFWLVAYMFLAGLGLIFASLSFSFGQVRSNPFLRRAMFGYGSIISGVLLLILLAFSNIFVSLKIPYTYNWSKTRGLTALNAGSKNLLAGLTEPTGVYVLMSPNSPLFNDIRNFVGNCQAYTNKITANFVDPRNDPVKYNKLVVRFKEIDPETRSPFDEANQGVLLVYGVMPEDVNHAVPHVFIPEKRLYEIDQKGGRNKATLILKAESEIMKELAFLAKKSEKRKIYLLQDDGALDMNISEANTRRNPSFDLAKLGAGKLVDKLKKENFDLRGLSFGVGPAKDKAKDIDYLGSIASDKKIDVPDDCDTLIIPGPSSPLPQAGLDALERYMDRGGKIIAAVDVVTDSQIANLRKSGLEDFLKKYGVNVTDQVIYRFPQPQDQNFFGRSAPDYRLILAEPPARPATLLAKQFQGIPLRLWSARVVKPGTSVKYQVEPLLVVNPKRSIVWADDSVAGLADFERHFKELQRTKRLQELFSPDPIPVAVTVTEGMGEAAKPRMVVFGDAEFLSNEDIGVFEANYDILASSIEWMGERGFVGPKAKESSTFAFGPGADLASMVYGAFWTMLVLIVILGVGVWLARRK